MDNKPIVHEEAVIKRQQIAVIAAFVLFALGSFISLRLFGVAKYGVLGLCIPMLYLGVSSIKNRISLVRLRGKKAYSRDTRAVVFGVVMIALAIVYIGMVFAPLLSNKFPSF